MGELPRLTAAAAEQLDLPLSHRQLEQFARYRAELLEWNQRINLTSLRSAEQVETGHFLDSLFCLRAGIPSGCRLLDVGSGAGFPGLALAIVRPDIRVTLLEATGKKARFLEHVASALELRDVEVLPQRAEELDRRGAFDVVVARALAALPALLELT
ncbi:MAG: 16S rRNA (guanine(527)-N(7))-methyltransferase RsmG, partial [Chloroflexota bacterium]|nr:16S rRNA (guanine(527)-N(7))-methyltransferase RsmG [Chloroflexota bacterium]